MAFTEDLAEQILELVPGDAGVHAAHRCIVDWAACALGGSRRPVAHALMRGIGAIGDSDKCTIVGHSVRASEYSAAVVNATIGHILDFDDVHVDMIAHPGTVVIAAALAVAEARHATGRALIEGVVAGYEAGCALGRRVNPEHYERGWHSTGTLGCFASAAGCSRILGLRGEETARAMSLGLSQASGIHAVFGTEAKALQAGHAAGAGVLASSLAQAGVQAPTDLVEGERGYPAVAHNGALGAENVMRHSQPIAILTTAFKYHASCGSTHTVADAIAGVVRHYRLDPRRITAIRVRVPTLAISTAGILNPRTGLEAKFSVQHIAALAAFLYPLEPDIFDDDRFAHEDVLTLRNKVEIEIDDNLEFVESLPADVTISADSQDYHSRVDIARGRPSDPLEDEEISEKFKRAASSVLGDKAAERALDALWNMSEVGDVSSVGQLLTP